MKANNLSQNIPERLALLREELKRNAIDFLMMPHTDEFGSEYLPPHAEHLMWITGFSGSSGATVISEDSAMVMTDGRYTIQLKQQVDESLFELCDMGAITVADWLAFNCPAHAVVGYDPKLYTKKQIETTTQKNQRQKFGFQSTGL